MSSWTLGEIFAVGEDDSARESDDDEGHDEINGADNSDSDDDDDDDDALERQAAFNKNKANSSATNLSGRNATTASNRSIRRYDEYGNFLSRSERARAEKEQEYPHSAKQPAGVLKSGTSKPNKRRISFKEDSELSDILEIPYMTPDEKSACFMGQANWESIDTDIEITTKRWKNHIDGTIKFDEDNNTLRGIEDIIFNKSKSKGAAMYYHRTAVLEEALRQKTQDDWINWDRMSAVSEKSSAPKVELAIQLAQEDEKERIRIWSARPAGPPKTSVTSSKTDKKSKRKSSFFGLFKKK